MKTLLSLGLVLFPLIPAKAQIFGPGAGSAIATGAIAGAIIGNNSGSFGNNGLRGAAWGAAAGLLLGGSDRGAASVQVGYGSRFGRYGPGPARRGSYSDVRIVGGFGGRAYDSSPIYRGRPYYQGPGLIFGGIAGGIIGNNSGRFGNNGARGAAWGAGIGYVLGSIAETNARIEAARRPVVVYEQVPVSQPAPAQVQPQQVTIINNYYAAPATPMGAANTLFGR